MRQCCKKCILCACAMVILSSFPAMAAPDFTDASATEESATEAAQIDLEARFSKDRLLKVGIGVGLGLAAVLAGAAGWSKMSKHKEKKEWQPEFEAEQQEVQCVNGRIVTETMPSEDRYHKRQMPADARKMKIPDASAGTLGTVHNVGKRKNQQDTLGTTRFGPELLAVVSDGMGGLSDGEKVSQQAVMGMFQTAREMEWEADENPLYRMLSEANEQILNMLGPDQIYRSGATLLAVLTDGERFHWVAVGDSRIYLYCSHHLLQINREHIYKRQLIVEAVNKNFGFSRASTDSQRDRLTSFLGMGELQHIDGSLSPVELRKGDKLLLMSDGIFNAISEDEIMRILENTSNAAEAAVFMEKQVLAANNPKQDNFTCIILDF